MQPATVIDVEERLLLARHLRGDPEAFPALVALVGPAVWSMLGRAGVAAPERDDLYQDVFVRVHRAGASYRADRPLRPWVLTIALNVLRSHLRRTSTDADEVDLPDPEPGPAALAEAAELASWMRGELAALPPPWRDVVELVCLQGLDPALAAELLEIPLPTLKTHLRRARLRLADALQRRDAAWRRETR